MLVIPAIDIRSGKCVRLRQGDYNAETVFGDDPAAMARRWVDEGARYLHLVDLDGAREGRPVNGEAIRKIVQCARVPCELGGGLRDDDGVRQALEWGIERVIIGTRAVRDPDWFGGLARRLPGKLVLGLDAKGGLVATEGWLEISDLAAHSLLARYEDLPLAAVIYTDIARDGMLAGPNFDQIEALALASRHPVIASGGIANAADVLALARRGIGACILGRSLYEGTIDLRSLLGLLGREEEGTGSS